METRSEIDDSIDLHCSPTVSGMRWVESDCNPSQVGNWGMIMSEGSAVLRQDYLRHRLGDGDIHRPQ